MGKRKRGGRRDLLRHAGTLPAHPLGDGFYVIAWACDDPACLEGTHLEGIHHSHPTGTGDSPGTRTTRGGNHGPFSDSSDMHSEGATGGHGTD